MKKDTIKKPTFHRRHCTKRADAARRFGERSDQGGHPHQGRNRWIKSRDAAGIQISGGLLAPWAVKKRIKRISQNIKNHRIYHSKENRIVPAHVFVLYPSIVVGTRVGDSQVAWWRGCIGLGLLVSNLWLLLNVPFCVILFWSVLPCFVLHWQGWKQWALPSRLSWRLQRLHAMTCILAVDGSRW